MSPPPASDPESLTLARASERLIQRFGGIRPMANKLEVPVTTVQGWKKRGAIPAARINDLRVAAQRHGIKLEEAELEAVGRSDDRHPEAGRAAPKPAPADLGPIPADTPPPAPPPVARTIAPPEPAIPLGMASTPSPTPGPGPVARPRPTLPQAGGRPGSPGSRLSAPRISATRLSIAAAVVSLIGAGVVVFGASAPPAGPAGSAISERRLGDLESKVGRVALEQGTQTAALEKQISALDSRLAQTATRQTATDLAGRLTALEQNLPVLEQRVAAQGIGSPALAVLLAATQLRNQLASSNPFINELAALRLTAFNDPPLKQALDQIGNRARTGIATESWLIGRFPVVQANIVRASAWNNPGRLIADFFLDTLSDWAPPLYRLTGVPEGSTPRAITDRTLAWMSAGDFSRAVEQLGELSGKPAEAAVAWLGEARARVIADRARELLARHMLSLAPPGTAP